MEECLRVLKPGGIVRVGVPDLERIARLYLGKLSNAIEGDSNAAADYDWLMLELFDQAVRERPGGEMLSYLRQDPIPNEGFVFERIGDEGRQLVQELCTSAPTSESKSPSLLSKVRRRLNLLPTVGRGLLLRRLLDADDRRALTVGKFRFAGEVHQWMYDKYSLGRLLISTGFVHLRTHTAATSDVAHWQEFHLDVLPDGQIMKPDLFFMEARKPAVASSA
jgi:hypothetical protein